jgi:hypothetical protein
LCEKKKTTLKKIANFFNIIKELWCSDVLTPNQLKGDPTCKMIIFCFTFKTYLYIFELNRNHQMCSWCILKHEIARQKWISIFTRNCWCLYKSIFEIRKIKSVNVTF